MVEQRYIGSDSPEQLVKLAILTAGNITDEIARITCENGQDMQQRGLAHAAIAVNDEVHSAILDVLDQLLHQLGPTRKSSQVGNRLRWSECERQT